MLFCLDIIMPEFFRYHGPHSPLLVNMISHLGGNVHICCFAIFETLVAKLLNLLEWFAML